MGATASIRTECGYDITVEVYDAKGRQAKEESQPNKWGNMMRKYDRGTIGYDPTPDEVWKYVLKRANQVGKAFRVRWELEAGAFYPVPVGQVSASKLQ